MLDHPEKLAVRPHGMKGGIRKIPRRRVEACGRETVSPSFLSMTGETGPFSLEDFLSFGNVLPVALKGIFKLLDILQPP